MSVPLTMTRLPDPARSQVILIGTAHHGTESRLPDLPAVASNLDDLQAALADPTRGWLTSHASTKILDPAQPNELGITIADRSKRADDLLLIYYAGHGLLSPRGELYLATSHTSREQLRFTAFPFDWIREILNDSPAANRVVILDCCYSGRAIDAMSDPGSTAYDQLDITGTYVLTSTTATTIAHAPQGARHTAFTGELIRLLRDGDPEIPELVTLDHIYRATHRALTRQGLPSPQQRGSNATPRLALVRNHASCGQSLTTRSPGPPDSTMSATAPADGSPAAAADTHGLAGTARSAAGPAGGYPPPQPLHVHPRTRQQPPFSARMAITAMSLCSVSCLCALLSAASFLAGIESVSGSVLPGMALLYDGVWTVGDVLLIAGTIQMWQKKPAGRQRTATGLAMVLAPMAGFELAALTAHPEGYIAPWMYSANLLLALSLVFLLLPGTSRYLKARYPS
jgi:Caspase domain